MAHKKISKICQYCNTFYEGTSHPQNVHCSLSCRFWSKVNILSTDKCWEWTRSKDKAGYGKLAINKRPAMATRIAWMLTYGSRPPGNMFVLHKCDNPGCVNPNHLFLGTPKDNVQDCIKKNRFRPGKLSGETNPLAKLSNQDVRIIKQLIKDGNAGKDIAKIFNVCAQAISLIKTGKNWKCIQ